MQAKLRKIIFILFKQYTRSLIYSKTFKYFIFVFSFFLVLVEIKNNCY